MFVLLILPIQDITKQIVLQKNTYFCVKQEILCR